MVETLNPKAQANPLNKETNGVEAPH